ncbi:disease resistance protein RGA2-like [Musa acuminata AAA Group]|uniref:disease resistance protein RGA2-like n=1 Tax=Musa acuminata AAA Group TaxID=214697 RepID=UPI0031DAB11D
MVAGIAVASLVASPFIGVVVNKLGGELFEEWGLCRSVQADARRLQSVLETILNVLDDAEQQPITNKALRGWLTKLKDAALDADDVVDDLLTEALRRRAQDRSRICRTVRDFLSSKNPMLLRHKMVHRRKDARARLDEIADERNRFNLNEGSVSHGANERETCSAVVESEVYGRDNDKEKVINFLLEVDNEKDLSILPIVGLGGIGKTTLAQLVYNDERVMSQFDGRFWVYVSENFSIIEIIRSIVRSPRNYSDLQALKLQLQALLSWKRYLLVLDDVWNENGMIWEDLKVLLRCGKQGSKIITTTRSETVARIMGTVTLHKMPMLSFEHCWLLFEQRAFRLVREEEKPRFVEIGKQIVEKCGGLPLAAKTIGSLMGSKKKEVDQWLAISESELWRLPEDENGVLPALMLSYNHLPSYLKSCFAYCSIFPKDYEIERMILIQLWNAEGFIEKNDCSMLAEAVGNQYFNDLVWRSLFEVTEKDEYDNIVKCKMHDLVHDLACSVTKVESSVIEVGKKSIVPNSSHYSLLVYDYRKKLPMASELTYQMKKLRSFILLRKQWFAYVDDKNCMDFVSYMISTQPNLRALGLGGSKIQVWPGRISKLKHLRYLDLSSTRIKILPNHIVRLYNLQTLNLQDCYHLQKLPASMRHMINLRHLDISGCSNLIHMLLGMGQLSNLQTLPMFIVGMEDGRRINELDQLNLIRGRLKIKNLNNVNDPMEALKANLFTKTSLQSLKLSWMVKFNGRAASLSADDVLEKLKPCSNLRVLTMKTFPGIRFPGWLTDHTEPSSSFFPYLVKIKLEDFEKCECLPPLGLLPSLKELSLIKLTGVKRIGIELYGNGGTFPSLVQLEISDMPDMEKWSTSPTNETTDARMLFPCLKMLTARGCPKLEVEPCFPPSVESLVIEDCENLLSARSLQGLSKLRSLDFGGYVASPSAFDGLQNLTVLELLRIGSCDGLTCMPESLMQHHIPSFQSLKLINNSNLKSLGEGRDQQPPSLFTSLCHLEIEASHSLTALPEWMQYLPLQNLKIRGCSQLEGRCQRETGEDWHKIAHIPCITIEST